MRYKTEGNKYTNKKNKQKLLDRDNNMVDTKGKRGDGVVKVKGVKYMLTEDLTLGGGHTMQYTDNVS